MIVIGLTGSICSGKSTVSGFLANFGAVVLNADEIGHEAFQPHTDVWQEVVSTFGEKILQAGGEISRQKLGEIVFNDAGALTRLNQIMHPAMYHMAEKRIVELRQKGTQVVVLEAPLLIEANWLPLVDQVWVTVASETTMIQRCCQRSRLSTAQALARIRSQLSPEEKIKCADIIIDTDCSLNELESKVKELWEGLHRRITRDDIRQALSRREKKINKNNSLIPSAVLIPVYEKKPGEYYLIVTRRTEKLNYHKGQISFPGGICQKDENHREAALRESWEEIGLNPGDVEILGELDDTLTDTTNYAISPFVGAIPYPYEFRANHEEVDEIIEVPLVALLNKHNFKEELELRHDKFVPQYFYHYSNYVIWGATARILKQFLEVVFKA